MFVPTPPCPPQEEVGLQYVYQRGRQKGQVQSWCCGRGDMDAQRDLIPLTPCSLLHSVSFLSQLPCGGTWGLMTARRVQESSGSQLSQFLAGLGNTRVAVSLVHKTTSNTEVVLLPPRPHPQPQAAGRVFFGNTVGHSMQKMGGTCAGSCWHQGSSAPCISEAAILRKLLLHLVWI